MDAETSLGICPKCGNHMIEGKTFYFCSEYKKTCDVIIAKVTYGVTLPKEDVLNLIEGRITNEHEFIWKNNKKSKARLKLDVETGKVLPVFKVGSCPKCGKDVIDGKDYYRCSAYKQTCDFIFKNEFGEVKITPADAEILLSGGTTEENEFTWKTGKSKAKLKIENYRLTPIFTSQNVLNKDKPIESDLLTKNSVKPIKLPVVKVISHCPKCKGAVVESRLAYKCIECDLAITKEYRGTVLSEDSVIKLLNGKETQEMNVIDDMNKIIISKLSLNKKNWRVEPLLRLTNEVVDTYNKVDNETSYFSTEDKVIENMSKTETTGEVIGKCPKCGGEVVDGIEFYKCRNYGDKCGFNLKKVIKDADILIGDAKDLLVGKTTRLINGFSWNNKPKGEGIAQLKFVNGNLKFIFPNTI